MKLDIRAFAITCSLLVGVGLFLATRWIIAFARLYNRFAARAQSQTT